MIDDSDVFSIAVDQRAPDKVFVSACSGVYRSRDAGTSWRRMATPRGAFRTYLVALDPRDSALVFAATSAGLLRSADRGTTWKRVSQHVVKSMAFDPVHPGRIFCASVSGGLLISQDGGNTMQESNAGFSNRNFAAMTGSGDALYTTSIYDPTSGGVFRSGDLGRSWRRMSGSEGSENIVLLAAAPDDADCVYAAGFRGLLRSTDGARTWVKQNTPKGAEHTTALLALSRNSLMVGTAHGLFRVTAGSWTVVPFGGGGHRVELLQSSGGKVVAAVVSGTAFRSEDDGASWTACGRPAPNTVWYGLTLDSGRTGSALAATSEGLFRSTDRCASWTPVRGGLDQSTVNAVVFHPQHSGEALAAQFGRVLRSIDGGLSWRPLDDEGRNGAYPSALLLLSGAPQRLFALVPRRGILSVPISVVQNQFDELNTRGGN
jgi:photosystem II stability/assembly factor-like uncharacterized protein